MYSHMWSTIIKDWVTLPNNAEKLFMQSLNQHGQGLRDKRSIQIMSKKRLLSAVVDLIAKRI